MTTTIYPTTSAHSANKTKFCRTAEEFRTQYSFEDRRRQSEQIRIRYPDRIPVICDAFVAKSQAQFKNPTPQIDKIKYLVPTNLTMGEFLFIIRKRLSLSAEQALFILINNTVVKAQSPISEIYSEHKNEDGFLYVKYTCEATFGSIWEFGKRKKNWFKCRV